MDLTFFQLKRNIIVCHNSWETLGNIQHFNCIFRHIIISFPFLIKSCKVTVSCNISRDILTYTGQNSEACGAENEMNSNHVSSEKLTSIPSDLFDRTLTYI